MNFTRTRFLILSLASFVPAVYAVDALPEKEEDIPVEFVPTLNTAVTIGIHRLNAGPKVHFRNLGSIPIVQPDSTDYKNTKIYSNGSITQDSPSIYETLADGTTLMAAGSTHVTTGWISSVTKGSDGNNYVTIYTPVNLAKTDSSGNPVTNAGGYVPVTSPVVTYNPDGSVSLSEGNQQVWASTTKFLGFDSNRARVWSASNNNQIDTTNHTVTMDSYGASSMGESRSADSRGGMGFEVSLERTLGRRGKFEWGFSVGLQLDEINAQTQATIYAHLVDRQDVYKMVRTTGNGVLYDNGNQTLYDTGQTPDPDPNVTSISLSNVEPSSAAVSLALVGYADGKPVYEYLDSLRAPVLYNGGGNKTVSIPLSTTAVSRTLYDGQSIGSSDTINGWSDQTYTHGNYLGEVTVHGYWQLKGAYYLTNIGPSFRYRFNDHWSINGKIAVSVAYVGAIFRADERFDDYADISFSSGRVAQPDQSKAVDYGTPVQNNTHRFLGGLYGELNAEYWFTERTGFYAGATLQTLRSFTVRPLDGRTATVDFADKTGLHFGIITRF